MFPAAALAGLLIVAGVLAVVAIALVAVGRETGLLLARARPAVFDVAEAVDFIADRLPAPVAGRLTHDDVRWILGADADLLEQATEELSDSASVTAGPSFVDETEAVARILERAEADRPGLEDEDVVAVLDGRLAYLEAIGAIGPEVATPLDPEGEATDGERPGPPEPS